MSLTLPPIFDNPLGWGPPISSANANATLSTSISPNEVKPLPALERKTSEDFDDENASATISDESQLAASTQAATFAAAAGPFGPFSRSDRLGRIVDWTKANSANPRHNAWAAAASAGAQSASNAGPTTLGLSGTFAEKKGGDEDDKDFTLVDSKDKNRPKLQFNKYKNNRPGFAPNRSQQISAANALNSRTQNSNQPRQQQTPTPTAVSGGGGGLGGGWANKLSQARGGLGGAGAAGASAGIAGQQQRQIRPNAQQRLTGAMALAVRGGGGGRLIAGGGRRFDASAGKLPSVDIADSWKSVADIEFSELSFTSFPLDSEDLVTAGTLEKYEQVYQRVNPRMAKPLQRFDNRQFFVTTSSDDPILQQLAKDKAGQVYATDAILSLLMAAPKTSASFDVIVRKSNGQIFFDRRADSRVDYVNVNEGLLDNPAALGEAETVNHPLKLSAEATYINHNFSQQIVKADPISLDQPNPFLSGLHEGAEPASVAFRYRRFKLADDLFVVARTSLNGYSTGEKGHQYLIARALNEYDPKLSQVDWRQKLESQPGAVLAAEMKLHPFKLARWAAEAQLSGADEIRLGFVSRENFKLNTKHVVLSAKKYNQTEFARALNVQVPQLWGALRVIVSKCEELEDGTYILIRQPNRNALTIYSAPDDILKQELAASATASSSTSSAAGSIVATSSSSTS